jgi:hypothetical protein
MTKITIVNPLLPTKIMEKDRYYFVQEKETGKIKVAVHSVYTTKFSGENVVQFITENGLTWVDEDPFYRLYTILSEVSDISFK